MIIKFTKQVTLLTTVAYMFSVHTLGASQQSSNEQYTHTIDRVEYNKDLGMDRPAFAFFAGQGNIMTLRQPGTTAIIARILLADDQQALLTWKTNYQCDNFVTYQQSTDGSLNVAEHQIGDLYTIMHLKPEKKGK